MNAATEGDSGGSTGRAPGTVSGLAQATLRVLTRLAEAGPGRTAALLLVLLTSSIAAQAVFYHGPLRHDPSHATRFGVSAALGLLHGRGLTTADVEAEGVKDVAHDRDLLALWAPEAQREPAHEPMPGVIFAFAATAKLLGRLCLEDIVWIQIVVHALLAAGLYLELRPRHPRAALLVAFGWALFVPQFRVTLSPGHDALTSDVSLAAVLALLHFERTRSPTSIAIAGALCGAGLWLRSYFFLLPALYAVGLLVFVRPRLRVLVTFLVPVVLLAFGLQAARRATAGGDHTFVRGALWHNFWTGVGQFDNPFGVEGNDNSVREFATRIAPGSNFEFPNYQYSAEYDQVLSRAGRELIREHPGLLARNALYRVAWLVVPASMPSGSFAASPAVRAVLLLLGIPVVLLAVPGLLAMVRESPLRALVLLGPWLALFPLALYFFNAKIPTQVYFGPLALAALGLDVLLLRLAGEPSPTAA